VLRDRHATYVWRGGCAGAEGWSVIIEPRPKGLTFAEAYDAKAQALTLRVTNSTAQTLTGSLSVFVGFA
jgi:hypothetical protein